MNFAPANRNMSERFRSGRIQRSKVAASAAWQAAMGGALLAAWLLTGPPAEAQRAVPFAESEAALLGVEEGRAIVDLAMGQEAPLEDAEDCSHAVHAIYKSAGHEYPYAPSSDIYAGKGNFMRVRHPRAGDVIAWWGHLGIVVDPAQHSFFSLVRTGLKAQDYESAYWRSRGVPRFYRLRVASRAAQGIERKRDLPTASVSSKDR
jgi:hypothetical protein